MKLTSILMLGACMQVAARVHSQTVTYSGKNVPLEKIFTVVEKQTGYVFFYDEAILKDAQPVSIRAENYSLTLFLSCVLNGQPLKYSLQNKTIIISRKEVIAPPVSDTAVRPAAQPMLDGIVMDMNGMPLAGASVSIKETGKNTITNGRGAFSIPMPAAKSKVVVSYVGYTTREVVLDEGQQQMLIQLSVAVNVLDEEVVEAYGRTSKRLAVGNIVKVSGEDIQKQPVMNPLLALNGRVPGVLVTPTSGYLSAPVKVEIRGRNTIDPNLVSDPLYVIDGMPLSILDITTNAGIKSTYENGSTGFVQAGILSNTKGQSPLFNINPADIESISVLKDAAATAIYGSRGANGVILITTKRAKPGRTQLNVNVQQSVSMAPRRWDLLRTPEYLQMRKEALKNDGNPLSIAFMPELAWDSTRYTDWQKELLGVAKSTEASMRLSGGDRNTSFSIGAGFTNSQEITMHDGKNQRFNVSSVITHRSSDQKLMVDLRALYSYTQVRAITSPTVSTLPPNTPSIFNNKGELNYADWNAAGLTLTAYPFSDLLKPSVARVNFINASLGLSYVFTKGLTFRVNGGYNNAQTNNEYYNPIASQNPALNPTGAASFGISGINNWNVEPQVNYSTYVGSGRLEVMAGGTWQSSSTQGTTMAGYGYTNDALLRSISNAPLMSSGTTVAKKKYASVHGRINYNWQNKYILELAGNRDGSSNFGPGRQFGNFWSAGAGWIASEEEWLQPLLPSWWSYLKLNASYGVTGLDYGGAYQYISEWKAIRTIPMYNGILPMTPVHAVNQDYQWQENKKINVDLSMGFLKDRITFTATWYRNRCNNQLTDIPTPVYTGFPSVVGNSPANVENSGWEGSLNAQVIDNKKFSWRLGFNIGVNRNKLLDYPDFQFSPFYTTQKIGRSLNTKYLFHYLGINPQNGRRAVEDYNHDGVITRNGGAPPATGADDRYIAIDPTPKYSGGISSEFTYKRFVLSMFLNFKKQSGLIPYTNSAGIMGNIPAYIYNDHWQQPGDITTYPRFTTTVTNADSWFTQSDGAYQDASFIRCNNLSLGYSLPDAACKKLHVQGITFSANMSNVFTITRYKGIDPETAFGILPQPRIIAGKLSFNF
ncbi:SusC/RagA family TonB-linked outer membrane protein [Niastella caeni]|nr:SusC/RagA family TonB-linked outer membrane protein [Niastella caeni]